MLEVFDGPDQLFLLIHILIGFITQPPFKLEDFFYLRAIENLVDGRLQAMQVLGIFPDGGLQRKILELRVCAEKARTLLVAATKSQIPLPLDLDVPVSEVINFPNLFHLFKWDILRRTKDRVLRGKNLMRPLLIKSLLL